MTMKKMMTNIRTLAALLIASATFAACSSDDNTIDQQPAGQQVYTMTVNAQKGGDAATTRALTLDGKTLNATWATTENIYVKKGDTWATGSLQPQAGGATATLKGTLSGIEINASDVLTLQFPRSGELDYTGQMGTLADIAAKYDYATATVTVASVSATGNIVPTEATTTFQNQQAIVKFTLIDKADGTTPLAATQLTVSDGTNTYTVTPASATSELYVAIPGITNQTVTLTATTGSGTYTYEKANVTFTNGKYYAVSVKMAAAPLTVEALTAGTVKVNIGNGSGTLSSGMKYSVNGRRQRGRQGAVLRQRHRHAGLRPQPRGEDSGRRRGLYVQGVWQHHEPARRGELRHEDRPAGPEICLPRPFQWKHRADRRQRSAAARHDADRCLLPKHVLRLHGTDGCPRAARHDADLLLLLPDVPRLHGTDGCPRAARHDAGLELLQLHVPRLHEPQLRDVPRHGGHQREQKHLLLARRRSRLGHVHRRHWRHMACGRGRHPQRMDEGEPRRLGICGGRRA